MAPVAHQSGLSEYELQRLRNMEENRKILESIRQEQIYNFAALLPPANKKKEKKPIEPRPKKKQRLESESSIDQTENGDDSGVRKSARLRHKAPEFSKTDLKDPEGEFSGGSEAEVSDEEDMEERRRKNNNRNKRPVARDRPNFYGAVPGIEVGYIWETRMECSRDGIMRPPVAGIHAGPEGAYSIALSGGYEDDVDLGDCFTYTGEGGRALRGTKTKPKNLRTAPQSKDQTLDRGNLALSLNVTTRHPVRVIRGYKLDNEFAPEYGYRYDGLYTVEKYWSCIGKAGFKVYKFALRRSQDQAPPPWITNPRKDKDSSSKKSEDIAEDPEGASILNESNKENNPSLLHS